MEYEDFVADFASRTGKFAIVDASVLETLNHELVKEAIMVPVKSEDTVFQVTAKYDDTVLRSLTIEPAVHEDGFSVTQDDEQSSEVGKDRDPAGVNEGTKSGISHPSPGRMVEKPRTGGSDARKKRKFHPKKGHVAPLSHDNGIDRRMRNKMGITQNEDIYQFIVDRMGKEITIDDIKSVADRQVLGETLDVMFSMSATNWELKDGVLTNGRFTIPDTWELKEGLIQNLPFDDDWLYKAKQLVHEVVKEEAQALAEWLTSDKPRRRTNEVAGESAKL